MEPRKITKNNQLDLKLRTEAKTVKPIKVSIGRQTDLIAQINIEIAEDDKNMVPLLFVSRTTT